MDHKNQEQELDIGTDSVLGPTNKLCFKGLIHKHQGVFSLRGEPDNCNYGVKLDLINEDPFFIHPYMVSEDKKRIIDHELGKLVKKGVLKRGTASSSSPVMLVKKKVGVKHMIVDLRHMNMSI